MAAAAPGDKLIDQENMHFLWPMHPDGEGHFDIPGAAGTGDDDRGRGRADFRAAQRLRQGRHQVGFPQNGNVDIRQQGGGQGSAFPADQHQRAGFGNSQQGAGNAGPDGWVGRRTDGTPVTYFSPISSTATRSMPRSCNNSASLALTSFSEDDRH